MLGGRLHAEGNSGESSAAESTEELRRRRFGVRFRGHFGAGRQAEAAPHRRQHVGQSVTTEQRRRSTAHEHGLRRRGARHLGREIEFAPQTFQPRLRRGGSSELSGRVGVEIAVPTPGGTERDVDVDPERPFPDTLERSRGQGEGRRLALSSGSRAGGIHAPVSQHPERTPIQPAMQVGVRLELDISPVFRGNMRPSRNYRVDVAQWSA